MQTFIHLLIGTLLAPPRPRDEKGLSQSTENAILLIGAVTIAGVVVGAITTFVNAKLPRP